LTPRCFYRCLQGATIPAPAHRTQQNYTGSLRYPHLERVAGTVDRLMDLLTGAGVPAGPTDGGGKR